MNFLMRKKQTAVEWQETDENIIIWCKNGSNALKSHIKSALFCPNMPDYQLLLLFLQRFNVLLKCIRMELKKEIRIIIENQACFDEKVRI